MGFQAGPAGELNGKDILVAISGHGVIGSQRGVTFNEQTNLIDISSKRSRAQFALPGRYSTQISLEALYIPNASGYNALKAAMRNGTYVTLIRSEDQTGSGQSNIEAIQCVVTGLSTAGPDNDAAVVSADFGSNGEWFVY